MKKLKSEEKKKVCFVNHIRGKFSISERMVYVLVLFIVDQEHTKTH